ncbi:MAG: hypothetical protein PHY09_00815 [Desulfuromonadaceae bacterium]|nr:hypothetical protein [Desulfuromonadaceae bacterium]MDD5104856.1 hypothetical protein [Desulfuromonadaceae bacterium]
MRVLPRINPLYEHIAADKVIIPNVFEKLATGGFSGYINHCASNFVFLGFFATGKLLGTVCTEDGRSKTGFEALSLLFDKVLAVGGKINVYQMNADLAVCTYAIALGTRIFSGEEVRKSDIQSVIARLKAQGANGVVRFYTPERSALVFYRNGLPIGYYYDGTGSVETSSDETRAIAALPGARFDIYSTRTREELSQYDLMQMVNLPKLWESARIRHETPRQDVPPETVPEPVFLQLVVPQSVAPRISEQKLLELVDDLAEIASAYLMREGRVIVQQRIAELGGGAQLCDTTRRALFVARVREDAVASNPDTRIDEMIELMESEMAGRLAE